MLNPKYRGAEAESMLYSGTRNFSCYDSRNQSEDMDYIKFYVRDSQTLSHARVRTYLE